MNTETIISPSIIQKAEQGDIDAMVQVADFIFFSDRNNAVEQELAECGMQYYQAAIQAGSHHAMVNCALVYRRGISVKKNVQKAFQLMSLAAQEGDAFAADCLGSWFCFGEEGVSVDYEKAYMWYSKAALLGYGPAYIHCSDMFHYGQFVHYDFESSFDLLALIQQSFDTGRDPERYADTCYRIGVDLLDGIGVAEDLEAAEENLKDARKYYRLAYETEEKTEFYFNVMHDIEQRLEQVKREKMQSDL